MSRESFDAVLCEDYQSAMEFGRGAVFWLRCPDENDVGYIGMMLPEAKIYRSLPVTRKDSKVSPTVWKLTGTKERPTLHPSINCLSDPKWHGWLRNGRFESC